jgi:hypothetical protein
MNPQPEEDFQQRLRKLEAEIDSSSEKKTNSQQVEQSSVPSFSNVNSQLRQLSNWFNTLSGTGKIVVGSVGVLLGLAVVQAVFKFVTSAISLALLAGLVYFGYKFIVSRSSRRNQ